MQDLDADLDTSLQRLPKLAREAIGAKIEGRAPHTPPGFSQALSRPAPVFVTLRIDGALRGCMGVTKPRCPDLVRETMERAVAAAFHDPRFEPLTAEELQQTTISVAILSEFERVMSPDELDPAVYGVELWDDDGRHAVLLPAIEGVDTVEKQLEITRRKGGIAADAMVVMRRFRALEVREPTSSDPQPAARAAPPPAT